jgi:Zn-dependent protease with chaperone function
MRLKSLSHLARLYALALLLGFATCPANGLPLQNSPRPQQAPTTVSSSSTASYHLSPEKYQKAIAYSRAGYRLYFISVFWNLAALLILLRLGFIAGLRDFAKGCSHRRILQATIFVPSVFATLALLNLPIRLYWHQLSLDYQQSVQHWDSWFWDWTKAHLLTIAVAIPVVFLLFSVIRSKPRSWWFYAWLGAIPFTLFLVFIAPWYIDPLFNKFQPLEEKYPQLTDAVVRLTQAAGHPVASDRILLMEASAKTKAINAYVTGLGSSTRIVIWDTSIQKSSPDELLSIVGHELGHYVMHHVAKGVAFFLVLLLPAFYIAYCLLEWAIARWGTTWGVQNQSDWAALAVLLLVLNVLSFFGEPIGNAFSRTEEKEADLYGLEVVQGLVPNANEVAAHAFQVLGEEDLDDPNPPKFIVFWLYTHPPLNDRLRLAHDFQPRSRPGQFPRP